MILNKIGPGPWLLQAIVHDKRINYFLKKIFGQIWDRTPATCVTCNCLINCAMSLGMITSWDIKRFHYFPLLVPHCGFFIFFCPLFVWLREERKNCKCILRSWVRCESLLMTINGALFFTAVVILTKFSFSTLLFSLEERKRLEWKIKWERDVWVCACACLNVGAI